MISDHLKLNIKRSCMSAKLIWTTPDADKLIAYMARVSNPNATVDDPSEKLIKYLINHKHWSPFQMANVCMEIETTRDIARQLLRHKSLNFQEFSQRYSEAPEEPIFTQARLQDTKNRQNSFFTTDKKILSDWSAIQDGVWTACWYAYKAALTLGIAKEVARKLLPEGLTRTKLYVNGTVRDWLHYISVRTDNDTQLEHRQLAREIQDVLEHVCPVTLQAAKEAGLVTAIEDA